ncbi:MAG TPA: YkgJ family cysteine cluster protein [Arenimonas sp.]|nr:YkgJ family cysteine cluster protein [Arenimonas sp.]
MSHPCLRCGACCATFRVSFHWSEAQPHNPDGPAAELVMPLRRHELAMRGTEGSHPRCVGLRGTIGLDGHCGIYPNRPSVCREVEPSWEFGRHSPQCDKGRTRHGLKPLTPEDWAMLPVTLPGVDQVAVDTAPLPVVDDVLAAYGVEASREPDSPLA